jgi:hypothetical protein
MKVPLSAFSTFVGATSSRKLQTIATLKGGYDPRHDYWKQAREFLPRNHQNGGDKTKLDEFAQTITSNRAGNYKVRLNTYKKWWGKHTITWTGGKSYVWKNGSVEVNVNPDLFVEIDGERYVLKLYFNKDPMPTDRANTVLRLLQLGFQRRDPEVTVGILDVGQGKVILPTRNLKGLDPVLAGEAASFAAMWEAT